MLIPSKFKTSKPIDILSPLKQFINNNYQSMYTDDINQFLTTLQETRTSLISLNIKNAESTSQETKTLIASYINNISLLKTKLPFNNKSSPSIDYSWSDSLKDTIMKSTNIHFEYFSCMYNLALIYFATAQNEFKTANDDENVLKEANKKYQHAAALYDKIKTEITKVLPTKEIPTDLTEIYLSFCIALCSANGQVCIARIAEKKGSSFDLQSSLYSTASDYYDEAVKCCEKIKSADAMTIAYLKHRKHYYEALAYMKLRDKKQKTFDVDGMNFGHIISYQYGVIDALEQVEQHAKKSQSLIAGNGDKLLYASEKEKYDTMVRENKTIYVCPIPQFETFAKLGKKAMFKPALPSECLSDVSTVTNVFDNLITKEIKEKIMNYKQTITTLLQTEFEMYSNNMNSLKNYVDTVKDSLSYASNPSGISDALWKKIESVQQKKGVAYLKELSAQLSEYVVSLRNKIDNGMSLLENEYNEDMRLRNEYGNRWNRQLSNDLNGNLINMLNGYKNMLNNAQQNSESVVNGVQGHSKEFEMLMLGRKELDERMPVKQEESKEDVKEAKDVEEAIEKVGKCIKDVEIKITNAYEELEKEIVSQGFIEEMKKKEEVNGNDK